MKILFLTHRLPYAPNRGDRIRAYHMMKFLSQRAELELISLVHSAEEESHADDIRALGVRVSVARVPRIWTATRAMAALATGRPLTLALLDAPGMRASLERAMKSPPDVTLAFCSSMARFALEPPLDQRPFVLDMVDVDSQKWALLSRTAAVPKRWIYAREARRLAEFEAIAVRRAAATVVVNDREQSAVEQLGPGLGATVVPNGVDLKGFRPGGPAQPRDGVVFVGVFNYEPNEAGAVWLAREVWPLIREMKPGVELRLVGANPTAAVRSLARDPSIEVTGSVPDVRPYLWRSAVSVAPIVTARGLQNKVLEAIAAGLPAVVTPTVFAGIPKEAQAACTVAETAEQFAAATVHYLEATPEWRAQVTCLPLLSDLDWEPRLGPLFPLLEAAASRRT